MRKMSRTAKGISLMSKGMSMADAAKAVGVTYQTLFANVGNGRTMQLYRANKMRCIKLAMTGKYKLHDLSSRTGMSMGTIENLLKQNGLNIIKLKHKRAKKTSA
jgi:lambda repressor-like predicted transcriptional regulator